MLIHPVSGHLVLITRRLVPTTLLVIRARTRFLNPTRSRFPDRLYNFDPALISVMYKCPRPKMDPSAVASSIA